LCFTDDPTAAGYWSSVMPSPLTDALLPAGGRIRPLQRGSER